MGPGEKLPPIPGCNWKSLISERFGHSAIVTQLGNLSVCHLAGLLMFLTRGCVSVTAVVIAPFLPVQVLQRWRAGGRGLEALRSPLGGDGSLQEAADALQATAEVPEGRVPLEA